ncbi:MAG: methyltransferase [Desulfobacterium sp.]|jgi:predicted O-methyltransferase YrrM|nr:methyltransferase [Desulfobacterium sp.]
MTVSELNPGKLLELSGSYWQTFALHAGVKLDLFTALDQGQGLTTAIMVADDLGLDPRATAMLLDALCAMDLLEKNGGTYANTPMAATFLSKDSSRYIGFMIMHHHHLVESWSRLDESVKTGRAVEELRPASDEESRESFLMGMFNIAMATAPDLVPTIDISGKKHLLDLGGGPGTYAIHFCMNNPGLKATIFDLPTTRTFAEKTVARFNLRDSIEFKGGNFLEDPIQGTYDVLWLSHILHGDSPADCDRTVQKAASALEPGGIILIHDFILHNTRDSPLFPALFSLNMLVRTEGGQAYSEQEIMAMLKKAGICDIRRTAYRGPTDSGIIMGTKPL